MPEFAFFRHCPACGRRFEVKLVKKESVQAEFTQNDHPEYSGAVGPGTQVGPVLGVAVRPTVLAENVSNLVDREEFDYTYECKHCGHRWVEVREAERALKEPSEYKGD